MFSISTQLDTSSADNLDGNNISNKQNNHEDWDASSANMGSSSANSKEQARLPEQGENSTSAQAQPWAPTATAFDTIMDTSNIVEAETTTRPVTPSQSLIEDVDSLTDGSLTLDAEPPSNQTTEHPKAKSRCSVCRMYVTTVNPFHRLNHFNFCWSLRYRTLVSDGWIADYTPVPRTPANVCILCDTILDNHAALDAHEHRLVCVLKWKQDPAPCPKCNALLASDGISLSPAKKAEHLFNCSVRPDGEDFPVVHNDWLQRLDKRKNTKNCPFCSKPLHEQNVVDAMFHRLKCHERKRLTYCPICLKKFRQPSPYCMLTGFLLWHVRLCQHGGKIPPSDKPCQSPELSQVLGRIQLLRILLNKYSIGLRKSWGSREHSHSFQEKRDAGWRNTSGLYLTPCTKLRISATYAEKDSIKLVKKTKSRREVWGNLERFRRSAYCVYQMSKDGIMVDGHVSEEESCRIVHDWCAEPPHPALDRGKGRLTCEEMRLSAVETAQRTGVRMPPGFEPDYKKPQKDLERGLKSDSCAAAQDKHVEDVVEQRADHVLEP